MTEAESIQGRHDKRLADGLADPKNNLHALTGIIDENGTHYATWKRGDPVQLDSGMKGPRRNHSATFKAKVALAGSIGKGQGYSGLNTSISKLGTAL